MSSGTLGNRRSPVDGTSSRSPASGARPAASNADDVKYTKPTKPEMVAVRPHKSSEDDSAFDPDDRPTAHDPLQTRRITPGGARDRAALISMTGPTAGQAFVVTRDRVLRIGRSREADIKIDEDGVSRLHAALSWDADQFWITDLGSRNGTMVDEQLIAKRPLADGAIVRLGARAAFRFALIDPQYEALLRQLYDSSVRDALTGAYNRQHFEQRLRSEVAYAVRHGTNVALCLFDIDHFKKVNDTFGHPAGDAVLRYIGGVVLSRLRTEDVFARYGGEEFAVILRGIEIEGAARAAERLRGAIGGSAISHDGRLIPVTISAGCATLRCCVSSQVEDLVAAADRRLYAAKSHGRNRVVSVDR